jgi:hypothetical protein
MTSTSKSLGNPLYLHGLQSRWAPSHRPPELDLDSGLRQGREVPGSRASKRDVGRFVRWVVVASLLEDWAFPFLSFLSMLNWLCLIFHVICAQLTL